MTKVLIVGAGRLGKGFVGETFFNAQWDITFIDKDPKVIDALNETGEFTVRVHTTDKVFNNVIGGYRAYTYNDSKEIEKAFLESDLIMLPLYPEDFAEAAINLAPYFEIQHKLDPNSNKTLICLTNKNHFIQNIRTSFIEALGTEDTKEWFKSNVIIQDSIVRRSTDADTNYSTDLVTTAVASLLIQQPVNVDFSDVEWLELRDNIEMLKDIKVFTINGPHAATAYGGYYKGYTDIVEASKDKDVIELVDGVHDTTVSAVLHEFPVTREEIRELEYLPKAKNEMSDTIYRVAYDPIRKVGAHDRFMGVIHICRKYNLNYDSILKALAFAFMYSEKDDLKAVELQEKISNDGIEKTVATMIGEPEDSDIVSGIVRYYREYNLEVLN